VQLQKDFHYGDTEGTEVLFFVGSGDDDPAKDRSPAGMQQNRFRHYIFTGIKPVIISPRNCLEEARCFSPGVVSRPEKNKLSL
jgi:hypothetical protein